MDYSIEYSSSFLEQDHLLTLPHAYRYYVPWFDRELIQQKCFSTNQTYINNYQYSLSSSHSTNDTNRFRKGEPKVSTSIDNICNCNLNQRVRTLDILEVVLSHRIPTIDCLLSQKSMSTCNSQCLRTQLVWVYNHIYCNDSCQHDIL